MAKHWWARTLVGRTAVSDPLQEDEHPDARFEAEWRPRVKARGLIMLGCLGLWAVGIESQLVWLQVVHHEYYSTQADAQHDERVTLEAPRGDILDRNGRVLATTVESFELSADPTAVTNPMAEARELCTALGDCGADELTSMTAKLGRPGKWVLIRKASEMSPDAAMGAKALIEQLTEAVTKANSKAKTKEDQKRVALILKSRGQRYYPNLDLAAQVIGVISADGKTGAGVEWGRNKDLRGVLGHAQALMDGHNREMFSRVTQEPKPGASVELTIDAVLQQFVEGALRDGIQAYGATAASAVVLAAGTGEILAQASYPTYNANAFAGASLDARRNRVVQDTYEPGSTLKIVTASAALNEGVLTPSTVIDCNPGFITVPGRKPIPEDKHHNYGVLSFEDVIVRSSNVGAIKIGRQVGADTLLQYLRRFPFGQRIAPDFIGEQSGYVASKAGLSESALASASMGYEVNVTPLQMAAAASVVANGGVLIQPHVVRAVIRDGRREDIAPTIVRRVITPETALTMTAIMEDVVVRGTGKPAALGLYRVAGKTGTAKKVVNGRYSEVDYNVSFVGFVPSRQPAFIILVVVDSPHAVPAYGGTVAGPIFKRIAEAALVYQGVTPSINPPPPIIVAADRPPLLSPPAPAATVQPIRLDVGGRPVMPDLRGMALREAVQAAIAVGLIMSVDGDGVVVSQAPAPGEVIGAANHGNLQLRREPVKSGGNDR